MNEKTEQMLQSLAEKLGVTIDHLWGVLITQARYDIITSVLQMAVMFAFIYWTIKLHIKFSKETEKERSIYYEKEEFVVLPMMFAGIACVVMLIFFLFGFNDLIASIFNPEFWALKRIMHLH